MFNNLNFLTRKLTLSKYDKNQERTKVRAQLKGIVELALAYYKLAV